MNLDGDLADLELTGNLFVETPGYHEWQDLALPRCKRRQAPAQRREFGHLPHGRAILRDGVTDSPYQVSLFERFGQEIDRASLDGADRRGNITVARDEHDVGVRS